MLRLLQHPNGPKLTAEQKAKRFRSYVELANWAEENLPHGLYFVRSSAATTLAGLREVRHFEGKFHVEGRGYI